MRRSRMNASQPRRGFTLIELLVVVGIIVLLIGILIPALGAVRAAARKTQTQTLQTQVLNAAKSFETDSRRLPGYFPMSQMADAQNRQRAGFTETENVLLDLLGGVLDDQTTSPNPTNGIVRVGPSDTSNVVVSQSIPLAGGSSYLQLGEDVVAVVSGQHADDGPDQDLSLYPEVIDPFGMPLLIFKEYKGANKADRNNYSFGREDWDSIETASFYWMTNAGYTLSRGLGVADAPRITQSSDQANVRAYSLLGTNQGGGSPTDVEASLAGILGNPGFAANRELPGFPEFAAPEAPRGAFNVISAGPDRIYFSSAQDPDRDGRVGYIKFDSGGTPPGPQPGTAEIERFDDIIVSGS